MSRLSELIHQWPDVCDPDWKNGHMKIQAFDSLKAGIPLTSMWVTELLGMPDYLLKYSCLPRCHLSTIQVKDDDNIFRLIVFY